MRTVLSFAGQVVAWLVILLAVAALAVGLLVPRIAGATPYAILTGSMRPHLEPGTLAVIKPADPTQIRVGDVVTYQLHSGKPTVVTHRVVATRYSMTGEQQLQTRGDANDVADEKWVRPVQLKGRLWYAVPYLGYVGNLIGGEQKQWVVYVLVAGLLGYAGFMFVGAARDRMRSRRSGSAEAAGALEPEQEEVRQ